MAKTKVDVIVTREGEITMPELLHSIASGESLDRIQGIVFRRNGSVVKNQYRSLIKDLDSQPFPAYDLFPTDIYVRNGTIREMSLKRKRALNILFSRGCPFDCNFCYHIFSSHTYRMRSAEHVMREILLTRELYNVETFPFADENLIVNKERLFELCALLKKEKIEWSCFGRTDIIDEERLEVMADSGCKWIGYGIESGSPKVLKNMGKGASVAQAERAIKLTRKHGISANATFIFGYEGEDNNTIKETLNFKKRLGLPSGDFFISPYPGTKLYKDIQARGLIKNEEEFILRLDNARKFVINLTNWDDETVKKLKINMERKLAHSNWIKNPKILFSIILKKLIAKINFTFEKII